MLPPKAAFALSNGFINVLDAFMLDVFFEFILDLSFFSMYVFLLVYYFLIILVAMPAIGDLDYLKLNFQLYLSIFWDL